MKIERASDTKWFLVTADDSRMARTSIHKAYVESLIRLGMEAQRERDAKWLAHEAPGLASELRAQPISQADIEAAIEEGE